MSKVVWKALLLSLMALTLAGDGSAVGDATSGRVGEARDELDCLDRETRLSRALGDRVDNPRQCRS